MARFLAVLHVTFGLHESGWANAECTVPGPNPKLANIRELEADAVKVVGGISAVLTAMIPLDGE